MSAQPTRIDFPPSRDVLAALRAGDEVLLYGPVFTARDATHVRLVAELESTGQLPYGLTGQVIFYAGPTPARAGRPLGSVGPTTARRMDTATVTLLDAGLGATFGKGSRSQAVRQACVANQTVFFGAVGGVAALLAQRVTQAVPIAYPELGTEALVRLELDGFPAFVAIDSHGVDVYESGPAQWRAQSEVRCGDDQSSAGSDR